MSERIKDKPFEVRQKIAMKKRQDMEKMNKTCIPVLVYPHDKSKIPDFPQAKNNFLCTPDLTMGQLMTTIRKRLNTNIESTMAIFIFIRKIGKNGKDTWVIPSNSDMLQKYDNDNYVDDGFIYITYSGENTFG